MEQTAIGTILEGEEIKLRSAIEIGVTNENFPTIEAPVQFTVAHDPFRACALKEAENNPL